jgi:hypothetical protein
MTHPNFTVAKNVAQGTICGSILIVYSITWMVLSKKKSNSYISSKSQTGNKMWVWLVATNHFSSLLRILYLDVNKSLKQTLKALTIIMFMVVFSWPLTILLYTLTRVYHQNKLLQLFSILHLYQILEELRIILYFSLLGYSIFQLLF